MELTRKINNFTDQLSSECLQTTVKFGNWGCALPHDGDARQDWTGVPRSDFIPSGAWMYGDAVESCGKRPSRSLKVHHQLVASREDSRSIRSNLQWHTWHRNLCAIDGETYVELRVCGSRSDRVRNAGDA